MQKIIENLDSDKIFILGAVVTNNEIEQKYKLLNENYPKIKRENMFFIFLGKFPKMGAFGAEITAGAKRFLCAFGTKKHRAGACAPAR